MKRFGQVVDETTGATPRIMRPSTMATLAYAFLLIVATLWLVSTQRAETFADVVLAPKFAGLSLFWILTAIHVLWFGFLLFELRPAWQAPPGVRKAQVGGVAMSLALVAAAQSAVLAMRIAAQTVGQ